MNWKDEGKKKQEWNQNNKRERKKSSINVNKPTWMVEPVCASIVLGTILYINRKRSSYIYSFVAQPANGIDRFELIIQVLLFHPNTKQNLFWYSTTLTQNQQQATKSFAVKSSEIHKSQRKKREFFVSNKKSNFERKKLKFEKTQIQKCSENQVKNTFWSLVYSPSFWLTPAIRQHSSHHQFSIHVSYHFDDNSFSICTFFSCQCVNYLAWMSHRKVIKVKKKP